MLHIDVLCEEIEKSKQMSNETVKEEYSKELQHKKVSISKHEEPNDENMSDGETDNQNNED